MQRLRPISFAILAAHLFFWGMQMYTCKALSVASPAPVSDKATLPKRFVVTGGSRGIGYATASLLAKAGHHVLLTSRDKERGRQAVEMIKAELRVNANDIVTEVQCIRHCELDVSDTRSIAFFILESLPEFVGEDNLDGLINNAGICLPGASPSALRMCLDVNFDGTLIVTDACMPYLAKCEIKTTTTGAAVIDVSSGDGELSYLESELGLRLAMSTTLQDVHKSMDGAMSCLEQAEREGRAYPELAHGPTPGYCISKAALNAAVRIQGNFSSSNVKILALCPGDVATSMCSVPVEEALPPLEAAKHIVHAVLEHEKYTSGKFYRFGRVIPW